MYFLKYDLIKKLISYRKKKKSNRVRKFFLIW